MTQQDLIKKLKETLRDSFNPDASFLIMQPMFKTNEVGLRKDELLRGAYVLLLDKDNSEMFEGLVYYFKFDKTEPFIDYYNQGYKKFMFPLKDIGLFSGIIRLKTKEEKLINTLDNLIEEFSTKVETDEIRKSTIIAYNKRASRIEIEDKKEIINFHLGWNDEDARFSYYRQEFFDMVDLFIEIKKDLEKKNENNN